MTTHVTKSGSELVAIHSNGSPVITDNAFCSARFELKMLASCNVAPCSVVEVDRRFRNLYRSDDGGSRHV
jgi:hypothetical protein